MKKIYMTLVAMMVAVCASAQVYVGGNLGIASEKVDYGVGDEDETVYSVLPEIGYSFNDEWAAGVSFGWSKGSLKMTNGEMSASDLSRTFEVNPYARYTFYKGKVISVFCDGGFGYKHYNGTELELGDDVYSIKADKWSIGLKPGIALNIDKFSLVAHVGFIGWSQTKIKDSDVKYTNWGMDFDGNNISLGVYYNF